MSIGNSYGNPTPLAGIPTSEVLIIVSDESSEWKESASTTEAQRRADKAAKKAAEEAQKAKEKMPIKRLWRPRRLKPLRKQLNSLKSKSTLKKLLSMVRVTEKASL